jgi:hypothetical protein
MPSMHTPAIGLTLPFCVTVVCVTVMAQAEERATAKRLEAELAEVDAALREARSSRRENAHEASLVHCQRVVRPLRECAVDYSASGVQAHVLVRI